MLIYLYSFIFMSSIPQPQHHQLRNINIFITTTPAGVFHDIFSITCVDVQNTVVNGIFNKNSDNTKNAKSSKLSTYKRIQLLINFPTLKFLLFLFFSASFSPSLYILYILFFKNINFALLIFIFVFGN